MKISSYDLVNESNESTIIISPSRPSESRKSSFFDYCCRNKNRMCN
ncbi:hypothetical protein RIR_e64352_A0A2I1EZV5_9GLOM [Rhizophagus irregularis DAOM 181602=DAOM 197198]|nr:hypothetical protein RIR_e64352_A0A2I1EZV5_9GLOM [Rhizophagus irregularis DAOM 181602=DAOM 197198]